mmetsp:Transcript_8126/g.16852  ORF Transcript_8126/g.16852 Transcript_8126/m.16852 type:complete len:487 (+) Transcript_8126:163-1623(+)
MDSSVKVLTAGGAANPGRKGNKKSSRRTNSKNKNTGSAVTDNEVLSRDDSSIGRSDDHQESVVKENLLVTTGGFQNELPPTNEFSLEYEQPEIAVDEHKTGSERSGFGAGDPKSAPGGAFSENELVKPVNIRYEEQSHQPSKSNDLIWLFICFVGIMVSFVCYGLLLEYTTSGGRKLHELSFLFVTSGLYTLTAAAGRYVRGEAHTTIPPSRFAILGLTSMGSTFTSVRSLRFVIYPIQVLAKCCKPVPVMLMGTLMGKRYPLRKYINVVMIVFGVALFMGGGDKNKGKDDDEKSSSSQIIGIILLAISLCFDGGTGAYEDKLMSVHSVQPFDLMYNIQLGKTILAGVSLLVLNQLHIFVEMCQEMGFLLIALGLSGASGQVFLFVSISKFGALTTSIIGLSRKVTTLLASIYFYGHYLNGIQISGLLLSITAMCMNFVGKSKKGEGHGPSEAQNTKAHDNDDEETQKMLNEYQDEEDGDIELSRK